MDFNFDKYKKHTFVKMGFIIFGILVPIFVLFYLVPRYSQDDMTETGLRVISWIIFVLFEAAVLAKLVTYIKIVSSKEYAQNYYISLHDERTIFIRQKTEAFTLKLIVYLLGLAIIVSGFFSAIVFFTISIILLVLIGIYAITYCYYHKKF